MEENLCFFYKGNCPRVAMGMECPECGYPYSEAAFELDETVPHKE